MTGYYSKATARDLAEIARSAEEARKCLITPINRDQISRYLGPSQDTGFPLEYAFYLLGDIRGKSVLDLGCGSGENLVPLAMRGARVTGIDISPDLIELAKRRVAAVGLGASLFARSAYDTGLPDESVDVIFCVALIHHLDIPKVCQEMRRILKKGGFVILSEPIRFSWLYDRVREALPSHQDISEFEHPLTRSELECAKRDFTPDSLRYFRLPFVPLVRRLLPSRADNAARVSAQLIKRVPACHRFATSAVLRLRK